MFSVCVPFLWWYNLDNSASLTPWFDTGHVSLEVLELLHGRLENWYTALSIRVVCWVEVTLSRCDKCGCAIIPIEVIWLNWKLRRG